MTRDTPVRPFIIFIAVIANIATATNGLLPAKSDAKPCESIPGSPGVIEGPTEIPPQGLVLECRGGLDPTGLGVNVTLESLFLDASKGDYLIVNPGLSPDRLQSAVFSWQINKPVHMAMPSRDDFTIRLVLGPRPEKISTANVFRLKYSTFDIATPPPTTTTTTTSLPTPPNEEPVPSFTVFVGGVLLQEFVERVAEFRNNIAAASNTFCEQSNISLEKEITAENVQIFKLRECPLNWPNSRNCSEIDLAVPVFLSTPNAPFELSQLHLQQMWNLVRRDGLLPKGMRVYDEPSEESLIWWIGVFFGIVVLFIVAIMLTWRIKIYRSSASTLLTMKDKPDSLWPKADTSVSSPQVQVPPYLVIEQPVDDAASRRFYYEERNSYANPETMEGVINEAYEYEDDDDALDIVTSRNQNYIYDYPDQVYAADNQYGFILDKTDEENNTETTL